MWLNLCGAATIPIRAQLGAMAFVCAKAKVGELRQPGLACHAPSAGESEGRRGTLAKLQTWGLRCISGSLTIAE